MKRSRMRSLGTLLLALLFLLTANIAMADSLVAGENTDGAHTFGDGSEQLTAEVQFVVFDQVTSLTLYVGDVLEKPEPDPEANGAKFLYWYDMEDIEMKEFEFGYPVEKDLTLVALFEERAADYTVTFLNADDTEFATVKLNAGDAVVKPQTDPGLEGYEFGYWYDVREGDKQPFEFTPETVATEDLVLKAFFTEEIHRSDLNDARIKIWMDIDEETQMGDTVTVSCAIANIYGWEFSAQWQRKDVGGEWTDIPGENGASYSFIMTEETLMTEWRVRVDVAVPEAVEIDTVE